MFLSAFVSLILFFSTMSFATPVLSDKVDDLASSILSMKERAAVIDELTQLCVKQLLPRLMNENAMDMWILISREYNEDPVLKTMLPSTWLSARRTTMLVFARNTDNTVNAYAIAPYNVGSVFEKAWNKQTHPQQWQALVALIDKHQPKTIGINQSKHWAHADGLVATDKERLFIELPQPYHSRVISAEKLAVAWLEQRIPEEMRWYEKLEAIAHRIIAQGFSNEVITVGETTSEDLQWWFRDKVQALKLQAWFHPSVDIQRKSAANVEANLTAPASNVIQAGDLLHVDFGLTYLRLNTDTQQHAYVLNPNETSPPKELIDAFKTGNQLQDIFTALFKQGRTGNEVLAMARQQAIAKGLKPTIYTHPIGYHGHGAGTTLGMWDAQQAVPGSGDYPLHLNTMYSIELNNAVYLPSWGKEIRIMLEENAFFDQHGVHYVDGRQTELHVIDSR